MALCAPVSLAAQSGQAAFERKDFAKALSLWRQEAAVGSADAALALGLLYDLGLGVPRDVDAALAWYLKASDGGLAEAQFNAAVMLDSGIVTSPDLPKAAALYARAGLNGNIRAQYNLALLYQTGEGVPRNLDLARYWLTRVAADLPAAQARLAEIGAAPPSRIEAGVPVQLTGAVVKTPSGRRGELVWAAAPGPADTEFLVQVATLAKGVEKSGIIISARRTEGSAIAMPLPDYVGDELAWRVLRMGENPAEAAAAPWQMLSTDNPARLPLAHVRLGLMTGDAAAFRFAEEVSTSLFDGGLWIESQADLNPVSKTSVTYFYPDDEEIARAIASYLPVLEAADAQMVAPPPGVLPGDIHVRLVGGPKG